MKHLKYSTFELLALIFGAGTVFALIFASPWQTGVEIAAQLLLIPIMVMVLHYGRKGGFISFAVASAVYLAARTPDIARMGLVAPVRQLLLIRILAYGIIGIGGGLVCSHIKYFFARSEQSDLVDEATGLFGAEYLGQVIQRYIGQFERYRSRFCLAIFSVDERLFSDLKGARRESELKRIASIIRNDIRAVDEAGRLGDTEFGLILPFTDVAGATAVGERLQKLVLQYLNKHAYPSNTGGRLKVEIFEYPEDKEKLRSALEERGIQVVTELTGKPILA